MSVTIAILSILGGLIPLVTWWIKRNKTPTPQEQKWDLTQQFNDCTENVHKLRQSGRHAEADAMLRRLAISAGVRKRHAFSIGNGNDNRKRLGDDASKGERGGDSGKKIL